jgi:hypothetical protein
VRTIPGKPSPGFAPYESVPGLYNIGTRRDTGGKQMDQPHKRVVTTHGVAFKAGQGRVHVPLSSLHPWLRKIENVTCPGCDTGYTTFGEFRKADLDGILSGHHKNKQEHPDVIASTPAFTRFEDCDCERAEANG